MSYKELSEQRGSALQRLSTPFGGTPTIFFKARKCCTHLRQKAKEHNITLGKHDKLTLVWEKGWGVSPLCL